MAPHDKMLPSLSEYGTLWKKKKKKKKFIIKTKKKKKKHKFLL